MYVEISERYNSLMRKEKNYKKVREMVCDEYYLSEDDLKEILNDADGFEIDSD